MKSFFLISILITAIIFGGLSFNQAFAHQDPVTCFVNNPSLGLSVLRDTAPAGAGPEDVTPVITSGNGKAAIGEQVIYKVVMKKTNTSDDCNFQDGTLKIKMPNGVVIVLSSGLPLITGTAEPTGTFTNRTAYVVVAANDNFSCAAGVDGNPDGLLTACAFYGLNPNVSGAVQGIAHTGPGSSESPASAFSSIPMAFTVPYTPSTDSSSKSKTLPAPIVNPTDKVTVAANPSFLGTFNGNYTLIDSTGTPHSGTCASDTVNATGFATLTCSATGTFGVTTDNTCWDVTVTAPSPYTPTKTLLLGSNDANDECFRIEQVVNACSPGYWKNDGAKFGAGDWKSPYHPGDSFATTFGVSEPSFISKTYVSGPRTLLDALNAQGPGSDFYRLAVDALLNAAYFNPPAVPGVVLAVQNHNVVALGFTENCTLNHSGK